MVDLIFIFSNGFRDTVQGFGGSGAYPWNSKHEVGICPEWDTHSLTPSDNLAQPINSLFTHRFWTFWTTRVTRRRLIVTYTVG